jgi:hypothetical protein
MENTNAVEQPTPEKPRRLVLQLEELEARIAPNITPVSSSTPDGGSGSPYAWHLDLDSGPPC